MGISIVFINDDLIYFFITIQRVVMNIFYNAFDGFGISDEFDLGAPL